MERIYNVPLRKEFQKAPIWKRAPKAMIALKEFLRKHMKSENIEIGKYLNQEIWKNGPKNPPSKVSIKAIKEEDKVKAELVGAPEEIKTPEPETKKSKKEEIKVPEIIKEKGTEEKKEQIEKELKIDEKEQHIPIKSNEEKIKEIVEKEVPKLEKKESKEKVPSEKELLEKKETKEIKIKTEKVPKAKELAIKKE